MTPLPELPGLEVARARSAADGVPTVPADAARFLHVIATIVPGRRIFEIGTGYGLSGLAVLTGGGPDATLFTVERDAARAAVARDHFAAAGFSTRANVMVGEAARLVHKVAGPFDLIVQDGETAVFDPLHDRLVALVRPGGVLVSHAGPRPYHERLAADGRLRTTFLPVGDGLALSVRIE